MYASKERLNKLAKSIEHVERVKNMPCCGCGRKAPSDAHHCKGLQFGCSMSQKSSDMHVIPLCKACHQSGDNAIHNIGEKRWESLHGTQEMHLKNTIKNLYGKTTEELGIQTSYESRSGAFGSFLKNQ